MKRWAAFVSALMMATTDLMAVEKACIYVDPLDVPANLAIGSDDVTYLYDCIHANIVSSRKYEVLEREQLDKLQAELKRVDAGMTKGKSPESNCLKAAAYRVYGRLMQYQAVEQEVSVIGMGNVKVVSALVELQIRLANVETGRILANKVVKGEATVNSTEQAAATEREAVLKAAIGDAAKRAVAKINDIAFPVYVISANARCVTGNISEEQVSEGDVWEVFVLGDELKDPQTGESLGRDEEMISAVRVSRPGPKTTKFSFGKDDADAEKSKKAILGAKGDGETMVMRKIPESVAKPSQSSQPQMPSLREFR